MITENLSTLKINKLSKEQYDRALANNKIEANEIYLIPDDGAGNVTADCGEIFNDYENNMAGKYAHAEGYQTEASGEYSHAEGIYTKATALRSHAEGSITEASGYASHAEGQDTKATGSMSHAEGSYSHAEGQNTTSSGQGAHAEGNNTTASAYYAHAEGSKTTASGDYSHAEGFQSVASKESSHAEGKNNTASGIGAHAEGSQNTAQGNYSHTEGAGNLAQGTSSHAEGNKTQAIGNRTHAEGTFSVAYERDSHAEGGNRLTEGEDGYRANDTVTLENGITYNRVLENLVTVYTGAVGVVANYTTDETTFNDFINSMSAAHKSIYNKPYSYAGGSGSHAEGSHTHAMGLGSHAEGYGAYAGGLGSHAEGGYTVSSGKHAHAEGYGTITSAYCAHAEGSKTTASGDESHAEGSGTVASNMYAHSEGYKTTASNAGAHAEGESTTASGGYSHSEGGSTTASGKYAHAEGQLTKASGYISHAEGYNTQALKNQAHAEGNATKADAKYSHTEGYMTVTLGDGSHAEGSATTASGAYSHAEGIYTTASGSESHAEGDHTTASSAGSHAEGSFTKAAGAQAHAEGDHTAAYGRGSHSEGCYTIASSKYQHVHGKFNVADVQRDSRGNMLDADGNVTTDVALAAPLNTYAHIVGGGTSTSDRKNIHTLDWNGNAVYLGKVTVGQNPVNAMDVATKQYVDRSVDQIKNNTADYVIESGSMNGWTYRRWNSGLAECWIQTRVNATEWTETGSVFYSDVVSVNYPFTFSDSGPIYRTITPATAHHLGMSIYGNDRQRMQFRIQSSQNTTSCLSGTVVINVVGQWESDEVYEEENSTEDTTETLSLTFESGDIVYDSNSRAYEDYVCVGNSSDQLKADAVWRFTPTIDATSATFTFDWDNTIGSVGYSASYPYVFKLYRNGAVIENGEQTVTIGNTTDKSGQETVGFSDIEIQSGDIVTIKANSSTGAFSTLKAFVKAGNSVELKA